MFVLALRQGDPLLPMLDYQLWFHGIYIMELIILMVIWSKNYLRLSLWIGGWYDLYKLIVSQILLVSLHIVSYTFDHVPCPLFQAIPMC